jgi:steroid delta-isomerase-like uncharacterized protein
VIRRYFEEVWNKGNLQAVDELLDPSYTLRVLYHNPGRPEVLATGAEGIKRSVAMYRKAFPDLEIKLETLLEEGDRIAVQWTAHATNTGEFRGIEATGKEVTYSGINIYRVTNGKVKEELYSGDRLGLWQQLGLVPQSDRLVEKARD